MYSIVCIAGPPHYLPPLSDNIYEFKMKTMNYIKLKLLKLLINSTFKYNESECRSKWIETTMDDLYYIVNE
jgi:hypothetical protein